MIIYQHFNTESLDFFTNNFYLTTAYDVDDAWDSSLERRSDGNLNILNGSLHVQYDFSVIITYSEILIPTHGRLGLNLYRNHSLTSLFYSAVYLPLVFGLFKCYFINEPFIIIVTLWCYYVITALTGFSFIFEHEL